MKEDRSDSSEVHARLAAERGRVTALARHYARAFGGRFSEAELESYGLDGLLDAARRFDGARGVPFKAFAALRIRGAILDGARRESKLPRSVRQALRVAEACAALGESACEGLYEAERPARLDAERCLGEHLARLATAAALCLVVESVWDEDGLNAVDRAPDPEHVVERSELGELLQGELEELPTEEHVIVRRHYFGGERLDEIATSLGLSKSWVSRLHQRAVDRLAKRLRRSAGL